MTLVDRKTHRLYAIDALGAKFISKRFPPTNSCTVNTCTMYGLDGQLIFKSQVISTEQAKCQFVVNKMAKGLTEIQHKFADIHSEINVIEMTELFVSSFWLVVISCVLINRITAYIFYKLVTELFWKVFSMVCSPLVRKKESTV